MRTILFTLVTMLSISIHAQNVSEYNGQYFGQKTPGEIPEIFAPNFISQKYLAVLNSVFSPDGKEFFFAVIDTSNSPRYNMYHTILINNTWTEPKLFKYSGTYEDVDMAFNPDGSRLYFCTNRPSPITDSIQMDIWYCEKENNSWGEPQYLYAEINSLGDETYPMFVKDGSMYFASSREGIFGEKDIFYAKFNGENFQEPVNLGPNINSIYGEGDTYVSPDESFIIVSSWGRPDSHGSGDLYISFKDKEGKWSKLLNMGKNINSEKIEFCPMNSPDHKILFYTQGRNIVWVDMSIINMYK